MNDISKLLNKNSSLSLFLMRHVLSRIRIIITVNFYFLSFVLSIASLTSTFHKFKADQDLRHESYLNNFQNLQTKTKSFSPIYLQN